MKLVDITLLVKDGGYEKVRIPTELVGDLVYAIQEKGSEVVRLANNKTIIAAGIVKMSKETGDRIMFSSIE
jgi:hypothetical protein